MSRQLTSARPKMTILQGLLPVKRGKRDLRLSGIETINFQLLNGTSFPTFQDNHVWILVMFQGAHQFLENCQDLQFSLCILNRNLTICTKFLANFIFATLSKALFSREVVQKFCSSHKVLHCALDFIIFSPHGHLLVSFPFPLNDSAK